MKPLDAFELAELRMLERGTFVGSDGRDWLRITIGITITVIAIFCIGNVSGSVTPVVTTGLIGVTATAIWTVHSGRKMVAKRIATLRSRA